MNYIEERDENLYRICTGLDQATAAMRAYWNENAKNIPYTVKARMRLEYAAMISFGRFINHYMRKSANYSVEIGGKTLAMDWRKMSNAEIAAAFKEDQVAE